jgi:hypothetical protein
VGTGGAVASKSVGRLLNRVEYRRLTRSDVYTRVNITFSRIGWVDCTFPPACGRCGGASNEDLPPLLRGAFPVGWIGADICFGALIAGRPFRFVRRDIPLPLSSDIVCE